MDLDDPFLEPAAAPARAGGKFKPKAKPRLKKPASGSTSAELPNNDTEKPSTQDISCRGEDPIGPNGEVTCTGSENPCNTLPSETVAPDSGTIIQSNIAVSEENVDVFSGGIHSSVEAATHAWTDVDMEKRMDDDIEAPVFLGDSGTQDSVTFRDFIAPELDGGIHAQNGGMQTEEAEDCLDMETLDIVEEGTTTYGQHSGKFQPKPKLQDDVQTRKQIQGVNEAPETVYTTDDLDYVSLDANTSEFLVNGELRDETTNVNTTFYGDLQEIDIPEMPGEPTSKMEKGIPSGGWEHEDQFECPGNNTPMEEDNCGEHTAEGQSERASGVGKSKRAAASKKRPRKCQDSNEAPHHSSETPPKKFKHSTRRQRKKTLAKELLETPDEDIPFLPIREMLQLVDYKEWLEKKETKEARALQTQERKASDDCEPLLNYHTYIQRQARVRWSKQDTERFYEGIREFGSDLSMIQQLFPDRTREQIKLKYKTEERREPMKLNDALATRAKDHYHYHSVIKKLQEAAAEAAREADEEDEEATAAADAEAETTVVPDSEEPEKSEPLERAGDEAEGVKSDGGEAAEDVKSDGGDDDEDAYWESYKSENFT